MNYQPISDVPLEIYLVDLLDNDGFFELVIEIQESLRINDAQFSANFNEVFKMSDMDSLNMHCAVIIYTYVQVTVMLKNVGDRPILVLN